MTEVLRTDFDVQLFCQGGIGDLPMHPVAPHWMSQAIGRIPVMRRRRDWQGHLADAAFDRQVARRLPICDLFHGATGQCLESLRQARHRGTGTVLDVVTMHIDAFDAAAKTSCAEFGIRPPIGPAMVRRIRDEYASADLIRVMSTPARQTFLDRGFSADRVVVVPPLFDMEEFPLSTYNEDQFRVTFVGLIEPWKGFHHLVRAFRRLSDKDAELVLWGGTGSRPVAHFFHLQQAADPRISLRPVPIRQAGLAEVYGRSSVVVLPSLADGFGYVVGEAMACGIPVITTPQTGASELVRDGLNGFVVPAQDVDALTERLAFLATNRALVRTMGLEARAAVAPLTREHARQAYVPPLKRLL
ncbi:MAG TPA: glycosyltransferase family 4 protein [Candidatus Xenobia bacterium]|jgi:glycosyltransferase involved in cell wall biosynthesis